MFPAAGQLLIPLDDVPMMPVNVGALDAQRFKLHPSVELWRLTSNEPSVLLQQVTGVQTGSSASLRDTLAAIASSPALRDSGAAAFWAYHLARMTFFLTQVGKACVCYCFSLMCYGAKRALYLAWCL